MIYHLQAIVDFTKIEDNIFKDILHGSVNLPVQKVHESYVQRDKCSEKTVVLKNGFNRI